jgi:hypothetical protein
MFEIDTIKKDIRELKEHQFFIKYFLPPATWYFYKDASNDENKMYKTIEQFTSIVSATLSVSPASVFVVGSAKLGCCFSPRKDKSGNSKLFRPFSDSSDIDIAIISNRMFENFWYKLRETQKTSARIFFHRKYEQITSSTFRGFMNGFHIEAIDGIKTEWLQTFTVATTKLQNNLGIIHKPSYRIYRHWEDFEQYHTDGITAIKRGLP